MKTSQEIATELARKCAKTLNYGDADPCDCPECKKYLEKQSELVLQSIPLVELLELYEETNSRCCRHTSESKGTDCPTCIAITNLTTKLHQLGIET